VKPYADTNFFTRLYLPLPESEAAEGLVAAAHAAKGEPLPVTWLLRVEFMTALELHVFVGRQAGHIRVTPEQAAVAADTFRSDVQRGDFLCAQRIVDEELAARAEGLASRHTAKHGFRTYDLLHVAAALELGCDVFWSFDERANKLAALEGLKPVRRRG
jgi:predicted nucleic acid-binding protein